MVGVGSIVTEPGSYIVVVQVQPAAWRFFAAELTKRLPSVTVLLFLWPHGPN